MIYIIRPNSFFTIAKEGIVYTAGQQVDLTAAEFELHKHKLEGVGNSISSSVASSSTAANIYFDDRTCNLVNGEANANLQSAIAAIAARLDTLQSNQGAGSGYGTGYGSGYGTGYGSGYGTGYGYG